jgi:hypothetical protein
MSFDNLSRVFYLQGCTSIEKDYVGRQLYKISQIGLVTIYTTMTVAFNYYFILSTASRIRYIYHSYYTLPVRSRRTIKQRDRTSRLFGHI